MAAMSKDFRATWPVTSHPRFYSYYVVAFLLKEPLATIALAAIGLFVVVRDKTMHPLARAFLLVPPGRNRRGIYGDVVQHRHSLSHAGVAVCLFARRRGPGEAFSVDAGPG
jgi:hypothetical protein